MTEQQHGELKSVKRTSPQIKRPGSAVVGYATYSISWLDHGDWLKDGHPDTDNGVTESDAHTIVIRCGDGRPESHLRECLLHELLHAVLGVSSVSSYLHFGEDNEEREEFIVHTMSPVLLGVLRDNPDVLAYLISDGSAAQA